MRMSRQGGFAIVLAVSMASAAVVSGAGAAGAASTKSTSAASLQALIATSGRPLAPAIGYSPRTVTYFLVWAEDRGTGTGLDIWGVRTTTTGIVAGSAMPIVTEPGDQSDPALAYSERLDSFLVVYTQLGGTPPIPPPGTPGTPGTPGPTPTGGPPPPFPTPPGPPVPLAGVEASGSADPFGLAVAVPLRAAAGALADEAWQPPPPPRPPTATPNLPTPGLSPTPGNTVIPPPPGSPTATSPAAGTPTATSPIPAPPASPAGQRDIHGIWVSESGIRLSDTFPLIASPADDTFPTLSYRPGGSYDTWALLWREVTGTDAAIVSLKLTGFSHFLAVTSSKVIIASGADHGRPSIGLDQSGEYLAVWSETPKGGATRNLYGRRLNSNVFPRGSAITLAEGPEDMVYPSVANVGYSEGFVLAWEHRDPGQPPDIRMRRLNRSGIPLRTAYNVASGPPFSFGPNLPETDRITRLLVWVDRNAASDHSILGVEINRDGRPLGPVRTLVQGGLGPAAVTPVVPPVPFPTSPPIPPLPPIP